MEHPKLREDPVGYVLDALWESATSGGKDPHFMIVDCVASKDFATAIMLALAIEMDKAKRLEQSGVWCEKWGLMEALGIKKEAVMEELSHRDLFWFLARHRRDFRTLGDPSVTRQIVDTFKRLNSAPPPIKPRKGETTDERPS